MELKAQKLIKSIYKIEKFSGGKKYAYSNEAKARHYVHKILMKSLEGQEVMKEEEHEFALFDLRRRPDIQIIGKNREPYFIIELKSPKVDPEIKSPLLAHLP